jgi:hypothetical protein
VLLFGEFKMMNDTEQKLKQLERMVECAYMNGFAFDEQQSPRKCAQILINSLREAIEHECILARGRGIVNTALLECLAD